jgi:hypothetical protein
VVHAADFSASNGYSVCLDIAKESGAIVPAEPSRPVTGEAVLPFVTPSVQATTNVRISPTATGNHPGTPQVEYYVPPGGWTSASTTTAPVAPGKPDEAPLRLSADEGATKSLSDRIYGLCNLLPAAWMERGCDMAGEVYDLEIELAVAHRDLTESVGLVGDHEAKADGLRAQLAARDARIAGLEASAAELVKRCQEAEGMVERGSR